MSYTVETVKEFFLVVKHYDDKDLHIVMSKREVQEELKSHSAHLITSIQELTLSPIKNVSKKYFLPKNWEKMNKNCTNYYIYKEIAESED